MAAIPEPLPLEEFLHELETLRENAINDIYSGKYGPPPFAGGDQGEALNRPEVIFLMQLGVYPEWREVHFLSRQIQRLDDADLVFRIGRQIFDEAKHTKVLRDQLAEWGSDPDKFWREPIYQWSASFDFMDRLTHPAEYFACSNFIGEGLFLPTIMKPMAKYDRETWNVYVEHIMPDEPRHIGIGKDVILKYCTTYEIQEKVRKAATILTKQYCIGWEAASYYAHHAKNGVEPATVRDNSMRLFKGQNFFGDMPNSPSVSSGLQ